MDTGAVIFIIGSGRSGTTILYRLLAAHPEVAWFSILSNRHPSSKWPVRLHRLLDVPLVGRGIQRSIVDPSRITSLVGIHPSEGEGIYEGHCGFRDDVRTTEEDRSQEAERRLKEAVSIHLAITGRGRFLSKRTSNTQRIRLIAAMFPDARFVHIIRDGRAVACSYLNVGWWKDTRLWWAGTTATEWEREGGDPLELTALHWRHNVEEVLGNREVLGRYMEVRYESLVANPRTVVAEVLDFCGLHRDAGHEALVPRGLPDMNRQWRETLGEDQRSTLDRTIGGTLADLGYGDRT